MYKAGNVPLWNRLSLHQRIRHSGSITLNHNFAPAAHLNSQLHSSFCSYSFRHFCTANPSISTDAVEGLYSASLGGVAAGNDDVYATRNGGGGGDVKNSCFKCGKFGHWARDCDQAVISVHGGGGGGYNDNSEIENKQCPCGSGNCLVLTANTDKNRGRKFYKCPLRKENGGCGFFEWCDNAAGSGTGGSGSGTQNYASNSSFSDLSCPCGAGFCLILTAKTGKNIGQQFYRCPANQGNSCGFFKWCNEHTVAASNPDGASKDGTTNHSIGVKSGSSCFKCGKEGHWAKDCSIPSSNSPAELGGKSASSGTCYKCGKEGHWAKDCSIPSSNSPAELGGKSASSGTCYKCGMPGHWARDCSSSHLNMP